MSRGAFDFFCYRYCLCFLGRCKMSEVSNSADGAGAGGALRPVLSQRLSDHIELARFAPGRVLSLPAMAEHLRVTVGELADVLPPFLQSGLLVQHGENMRVAPVDKGYLLSRLDRRLELERLIGMAAARRAGQFDDSEIKEIIPLFKRSALVGDIEGYMLADRSLEKAISGAAMLPEAANELFRIKREFRRAWMAHNRLRDLNVPAAMRAKLVEAILAGDAEGAQRSVEEFIDYLRGCFSGTESAGTSNSGTFE